MKYNIKKLQGGGALSAPTSYITYQSNQPQVVSQGKTQDSQKIELVDNDMFKKIMENSLTSDAMIFFNKINKLESDPAIALGFRNKNMALQTEIIQMFNNKKNYDSAKQVAKENGTLDEIATGDYGIYVMDRNRNIKEVSNKEYSSNMNNYKPLTVSELLIARNDNPKLANDENIFSTVENNVSLEKVLTKVDNIIKNSSKTSMEVEDKYSQQLQGVEGFNELNKALQGTKDGQYSFSNRTAAIKNAEAYIWSALTIKERQRLELEGNMYGKQGRTGADIVHNAIMSRTEQETKIAPTKPTKGEGDGIGESGGLTPITQQEIWTRGAIPTGEVFVWNDPKTGLKMNIPVTASMKPMDKNGNLLGKQTIAEFKKSDQAKMLDTSKMSFGMGHISMGDENKIAITDDDLFRVYLPLTNEGTADFSYLEKVQRVNDDLLARKNKGEQITAETMNSAYKLAGVPMQFRNNPEDPNNPILESENAAPFAITYGYTTGDSKVVDDENNENYITKISGGWLGHTGEEAEVESAYLPIFKRSEDGKDKGYDPRSWLGETWYKGIVAIPFKKDASIRASSDAGHLYQGKQSFTNAKVNYNIDNARSINVDPSKILNNE